MTILVILDTDTIFIAGTIFNNDHANEVNILQLRNAIRGKKIHAQHSFTRMVFCEVGELYRQTNRKSSLRHP